MRDGVADATAAVDVCHILGSTEGANLKQKIGFDENILLGDYRVVHMVKDHLMLTLKYKLRFSRRSLYCG